MFSYFCVKALSTLVRYIVVRSLTDPAPHVAFHFTCPIMSLQDGFAKKQFVSVVVLSGVSKMCFRWGFPVWAMGHGYWPFPNKCQALMPVLIHLAALSCLACVLWVLMLLLYAEVKNNSERLCKLLPSFVEVSHCLVVHLGRDPEAENVLL